MKAPPLLAAALALLTGQAACAAATVDAEAVCLKPPPSAAMTVVDLRGPGGEVTFPGRTDAAGMAAPATLYSVIGKTRRGARRETLVLCSRDQPPRLLWREDSDGATGDRPFVSAGLALVPGPDGWVDIELIETVLPRAGDREFRPGPPLLLRFRRGPDGVYARSR